MDTTVTGIGSVVVAGLRSAGYLESTIGQYEKTIKALTGFAEERGGTYTPALGAAFASMTISPRTGRFSAQRSFDYRRLVSVFDSYLATGRVDLSCRKRGGGGRDRSRSSSSRWPPRGKPTWMTVAWLRPPGRFTAGYPAATWCSWITRASVSRMPTARACCGSLASLSARWATSSLFWVVSNFRPFLAFTGRTDLVDAARLAGGSVPTRSCRSLATTINVLSSSVRVGGDRRAGCGDHPAGAVNGLRACDIVNLRLADIDWRGQTSRSCSTRRTTR